MSLSLRVLTPLLRVPAPSLRVPAPSLRVLAPSLRVLAPLVRERAPSLRVLAPRAARLRVLMPLLAGLLLSACAQSAVMQNTNLVHPDSGKTSAEPAKSLPDRPAAYGVASYYSEGHATASGERFDPRQMTAAHRSLPFGTKLRVTNVKSGHSVVVRVNDRGPFVHGRVLDVSYAAARELDLVAAGTAKVKVEVLEN